MMDDEHSQGGLGIVEVATIVLVILKLFGLINWSWLWVLAPLAIAWAFLLAMAVVVMAYAAWTERRQ